ncbi:YmfQ family protein [Burkholderia vietnamiensis]|uniref:YmfQ family protein n=1 Tax=Burkholderia vietnamiensis TaxID=60552 RepID=UPI00084228CA|nr:putative phage tail protein [Burkholderia vietnamiensis]AOK40847.1 phage tail protein [Burkholderia vietnamiensis]
MGDVRTASDYLAQLRQLLPPGPAWDVELAADVDAVLRGLSGEFARLDARASDLLNEIDPATMRELVPDYERVMALPDPCLGDAPTFDARKKAVIRRLVGMGGQNAAFFVGVAVEQGYPDAYVVEHRAPRFGRSRFGVARFGTWAAQFFWEMHLGARRLGGARFGVTHFSERFGSNPNSGIECLVQRWMPAHTVVDFKYGD